MRDACNLLKVPAKQVMEFGVSRFRREFKEKVRLEIHVRPH